MSHYFQYLYTICETFDSDCNGCKYRCKYPNKPNKYKYCFLRQVLNLNNDYFFFSIPEAWTVQDFNHIDKKKMVFLEGI